ncbi:MAG: M14 family metallopeptidase [Bacteroidota bacterium]
MKKRIYLFIMIAMMAWMGAVGQNKPLTPFETSKGKQTATYDECISYYKMLDSMYVEIKMLECGPTDIGKNLNLVVISSDQDFDPVSLRKKNKEIILINNGIHPGEPDGIDASMMLARDLMQKPELHKLLDNIVIIIVPIYNIDGALVRNSTSRVNQNGPESFGFRGNAENLDLNRDFIKCDSKNARSWEEIFQRWKPSFLIDNHVSDGADYQYTLTYFVTQHNKVYKDIDNPLSRKILPALKGTLEQRGIINCPYVEEYKSIPDSGIVGFYDSPRYCTGYAALFNCIGFTVETHMLKPFDKRVEATYQFMITLMEVLKPFMQYWHNNLYGSLFNSGCYPTLPSTYTLDTTKFDTIDFKGYEAKYKKSEVSGYQRLYYDRNSPYSKKIRYYNEYKVVDKTIKPFYYVIPQAWYKPIDLLKLNGTKLKRLSKDTVLKVASYYIKDYETVKRPYEGHYLHYNTKINIVEQRIQYHKGDYVITTKLPLGGEGDERWCEPVDEDRYAYQTLEPEATDSYFNWNFFDAILMQKEWYSDYVFEDIAADLLKNDKTLRDSLDAAKKKDAKLANDGRAQLDWLYHHSKYYEKTHNLYPVGKVMEYVKLPLD